MIYLENDVLKVSISKHGAEIKSIIDKQTATEYMWQADKEYWGRTSPILFPFVGKLKDNTYFVNDKSFSVGQHGFARDNDFICTKQTEDTACFLLKATPETRELYPFEFALTICYRLEDNRLDVVWQVANEDEGILPFSIGAHPAFNMRLYDALETEDYYLEFDHEIFAQIKLLNQDGHFTGELKDMGHIDSLRLSADLFVGDALVIDATGIDTVSLKNMKNDKSVLMDLSAFKWNESQALLGIWSPYADGDIAPFVCLEPWFGHADFIDGPYDILEKPGIIKLEKGKAFTTQYGLIFK